MPPSRTETWVVKLVGGPEDGAEVRMNDMFCDIKFPVPGMPTVVNVLINHKTLFTYTNESLLTERSM